MEWSPMGLSRRSTLQLISAGVLLPLAGTAIADIYPSRVVRLFVGFPPGGGADLATRIVANGLSELWRQQVIVENRPGAGARIATDSVAHAAGDGYTMLLAPGSPLVQSLLFSTLTYDPAADLAPVSLVGTYPNIIVVPNSSPFNSLEALIAYAEANPGKMSWGSPGIGSVPHLAGELFKHRAGIDITHVPYRGATQGLMSDFLAGRLDLMLNTTGSLLEPVRSKQVRGLAVTSAKRFPDQPELPTVAEAGVAGFDVSSWYAIYVPAKTPRDVVAKVNADMTAVLNDDPDQGQVQAARRLTARFGAAGACGDECGRCGAVGADHQGGQHQSRVSRGRASIFMRRVAEEKICAVESRALEVRRARRSPHGDHQLSGCVRQGDCDGRHAVLVETPFAPAL
jgi:tripartite-type tricarboxylate transporter receptor subunit TctC